jgi:hypothetical protein
MSLLNTRHRLQRHTQMTADFFRATLTEGSNDLQEMIDHGKEEQVEETSSGKT